MIPWMRRDQWKRRRSHTWARTENPSALNLYARKEGIRSSRPEVRGNQVFLMPELYIQALTKWIGNTNFEF
jgi:hypothetical protein